MSFHCYGVYGISIFPSSGSRGTLSPTVLGPSKAFSEVRFPFGGTEWDEVVECVSIEGNKGVGGVKY